MVGGGREKGLTGPKTIFVMNAKKQAKSKQQQRTIRNLSTQVKQARAKNKRSRANDQGRKGGSTRTNRSRNANSSNGVSLAMRTSRSKVSRQLTQATRANSKYLGEESDTPLVREFQDSASMGISANWVETTTHGGSHVIGTEYLGPLTVRTTAAPSQTQPGEVVYRQPITPLALAGTRLRILAELFQRYRMNHLTLHYVPVVPATVGGAFSMFMSYDPDIDLTSISTGDQLQRVVLSMEDAVMVQVFGGVSITWRRDLDTEYWTRLGDSSARLSIPGSFTVISASSFNDATAASTGSLTAGNIWISYDIEFYNIGLLLSDPSPPQTLAGFAGLYTACFVFEGVGNPIPGEPVVIRQSAFVFTGGALDPGLGYIWECVANQLWREQTGGLPLAFRTISSDPVQITMGTPFYLYPYVRPSDGITYFQLHTTITGALNGDADLVWALPNVEPEVFVGFTARAVPLL
jgi:hypothetical protein